MNVESIGNTLEESNSISRRAGIQQEDFLEVLLAQLTFQDPLEPLDNNEFIAQFAQLTNLEQTQQFNNKLDSLLAVQSSTQALNLLGRTVEVQTDTALVVGEVTTAVFRNGVPELTIREEDGSFLTDITLGQLSIVR